MKVEDGNLQAVAQKSGDDSQYVVVRVGGTVGCAVGRSSGNFYHFYPLQHICRHSPDGFECGYGGSGPSDLALSILADYLGSVKKADPHYQEFKWRFIANMPQIGGRITGGQIGEFLEGEGKDGSKDDLGDSGQG